METLIVKVDNKKNVSFLRKLLNKFNFVVEVSTENSNKSVKAHKTINVAGKLHKYADTNKLVKEKSVWEVVVKNKHGFN